MELSMTAMVKSLNEPKVNKEMVVQALVDSGYLVDIKTITEEGQKVGIRYKEGRHGEKWPVYSEGMQRRVKKSLPKIMEKYASLYVEPKKKKETVSVTEQPQIMPNENAKYQYLNIQEDTMVNDTETTGLTETDEIVEFSLVGLDKTVLYHSYFYPDCEVNPFAAKVNHLSREKLEGNPRFVDEWPKIRAIIGDNKLLGHNLKFDRKMVIQTLLKQGYSDAESEVDAVYTDMIDTLPLAKRYIKTKSYSLNNLTTLLGITREEQHDATDDCVLNIEFVERLEDVIRIRREYDFITV